VYRNKAIFILTLHERYWKIVLLLINYKYYIQGIVILVLSMKLLYIVKSCVRQNLTY